MSEQDYGAMLGRLHYAAERGVHDPELHLDAAAWIEKLQHEIANLEAIISNQRAEISRLMAHAIY
jgi:Ser/Thr protein kinase RdoA (MazF antagonist)